jgi:hypothetical protein
MHSSNGISIKIGGKYLTMNKDDLNKKDISCHRLLKVLFGKHSIKLKRTYNLFEYKNGIERMISSNEKVSGLLDYWIDEHVELTVKKVQPNDDVKKFDKKLIKKIHKKNRQAVESNKSIPCTPSENKRLDEITKDNQVDFLRYIYMKLKAENLKFIKQNNDGDLSFNSYGSSNENNTESYV